MKQTTGSWSNRGMQDSKKLDSISPIDKISFSSPDLLTFLGIAFGLAWIMWSIAWLTGFQTDQPLTMALISLSMFVPGIAALVASRPLSRPLLSSFGLRLGKWRYYLLTLGIMPVLLGLGVLFSVLLGIQRPDPEFTALREIAQRYNMPVPDPSILLPQIILPALLVQPFITGIFALGEELGWRGYLLKKFIQRGEVQAAAIVGIIWGIWHAPIIVMGWNYPGHSLLGPLMMMVVTVVFGIIFAWLRLRSGSVLVAALAHGALNSQVGMFSLLVTKADPLLGVPMGIAVLAPAGIFAVWLVLSRRLSSEPCSGNACISTTE